MPDLSKHFISSLNEIFEPRINRAKRRVQREEIEEKMSILTSY